MFYDLYFGVFIKGDVAGILIGVLVWLTTLFIGYLIYMWIYQSIDQYKSPRKVAIGTIIGKYYTAPYTTSTMVKSGDSWIPIITNHPATWSLSIELLSKTDSIYVDESYYDSVSEGNRVTCSYVIGRMSGDLYIKSV